MSVDTRPGRGPNVGTLTSRGDTVHEAKEGGGSRWEKGDGCREKEG